MGCDELRLPERGRAYLPSLETVHRAEDSLVVQFSGPRDVVSTSWLNGGYRRDLSAVFNHQIPLDACDDCHENGGVKTYLETVAASLGLDPRAACGLVTRAEMKNAVAVTARYRDLPVTAIVTAGIDKNGGRAGDPASYYEENGSFEPVGGTVNTVLVIGADLPEYALCRAVVTASEAKAVALQQLMARSLYSPGIATGSGTDMIAVVADPRSSLHLSDAGKHSKLGELIGKTVINATTAALKNETGLSPVSQRDVLVRLSRFGIAEADLCGAVPGGGATDDPSPSDLNVLAGHLQRWARRPENVARAAAALHLLDEGAWGLLPDAVVRTTIARILHDDGRAPTGLPDTGRAVLVAGLSRLAVRDLLSEREEEGTADGAVPAGPARGGPGLRSPGRLGEFLDALDPESGDRVPGGVEVPAAAGLADGQEDLPPARRDLAPRTVAGIDHPRRQGAGRD